VLVDNRLLVKRRKGPQLLCFSSDLISIHLPTKGVRVPLQLSRLLVELFGFSMTHVGLAFRVPYGREADHHSSCSVLRQPYFAEEQTDLHEVCLQTRNAERENVPAVQKEVQDLEQAAENAKCLNDTSEYSLSKPGAV